MKNEIKTALRAHGVMYYGDLDRLNEIADEWLDNGFSESYDEWMEAGFWCPITAAQVRDMGIDASDVAALCNDLITGYDDPVHSMCNGDLSTSALTE